MEINRESFATTVNPKTRNPSRQISPKKGAHKHGPMESRLCAKELLLDTEPREGLKLSRVKVEGR